MVTERSDIKQSGKEKEDAEAEREEENSPEMCVAATTSPFLLYTSVRANQMGYNTVQVIVVRLPRRRPCTDSATGRLTGQQFPSPPRPRSAVGKVSQHPIICFGMLLTKQRCIRLNFLLLNVSQAFWDCPKMDAKLRSTKGHGLLVHD